MARVDLFRSVPYCRNQVPIEIDLWPELHMFSRSTVLYYIIVLIGA